MVPWRTNRPILPGKWVSVALRVGGRDPQRSCPHKPTVVLVGPGFTLDGLRETKVVELSGREDPTGELFNGESTPVGARVWIIDNEECC